MESDKRSQSVFHWNGSNWTARNARSWPRFQPKEDQIAIAHRGDPKFADLEKKAAKWVLVHDVEYIEPGTKAKHSTRIGEATFDLELAIRLTENVVYEAALNATRSQGARLPASVKPGTHLTPAQMKGIQRHSMAFRLGLLPGQSMAIGGLARAGDVTRNKSSSKMLVLIIGLEKPEEAKRVSERHSMDSLR